MKTATLRAVLVIGAGVVAAACGERTEDPAAVEKSAVPPVPVVPPGTAGGPSGKGLANPPGPEGLAGESVIPGIDTTVADIMNRPDLYAGRAVTAVSSVEEIFTPWSFKLDEQQALAGGIDNDILVVGAIPLTSWGFDDSWLNAKVKVTGTVRILQAEDFRREYGRGVDDLLFRRFEGKPAIIARAIEKAG
jgi:hypothetical protein